MHVVDSFTGELQACARSGPRNASRVPPETGGRTTALDPEGLRGTTRERSDSGGAKQQPADARLPSQQHRVHGSKPEDADEDCGTPLARGAQAPTWKLIAGQSPLRTWQSAWVAPPMQQPNLDQVAVCPGDSSLTDECELPAA